MVILDGRALANQLKAQLAEEAGYYKQKVGRPPHLSTVLVGEDAASKAYVRNKVKACEQSGFLSSVITKPAGISQSELLEIVEKLNMDPLVDGFIVQLPLPKHINANEIILAIDPDKDVDGFHPMNFGKMAQGMDAFIPATPYGILLLLEHFKVPTDGKEVVVIGRSNIVGTPMSILLSRNKTPGNATVTLVHSHTHNLIEHARRADILIAAIGKPKFIKADMVKEGAAVIDVGINRVKDPLTRTGYRLVGDVDFQGLAPKVNFITPVPGGVGPMTVAGLMMNTMKAYKAAHNLNDAAVNT